MTQRPRRMFRTVVNHIGYKVNKIQLFKIKNIIQIFSLNKIKLKIIMEKIVTKRFYPHQKKNKKNIDKIPKKKN